MLSCFGHPVLPPKGLTRTQLGGGGQLSAGREVVLLEA